MIGRGGISCLPKRLAEKFWRTKLLEELTQGEWESLCDGCGKCCLNKLEDDETGEIAWTDVACTLLDGDTCRCNDYGRRTKIVPDCVPLDAAAVRSLTWLPRSCAYRRVAEGRDLAWWHHLVSGSRRTVHLAGVSVRGRTVSEDEVPVEAYEERLVVWPDETD